VGLVTTAAVLWRQRPFRVEVPALRATGRAESPRGPSV
jgi:hypothetical protein